MDSTKLISQLISLQLFSKLASLLLNFATARIVSKEVFAYANIQLTLTYTCCLFWWRECIRKVIQK
jgi:hypothetical protein